MADSPSGQLRITLDEARSAATGALVAQRYDEALLLAEGVLMGAPQDVSALFIKARALRELGRDEEALSAARAAWGAAERPRDRYFAAMMMAQTRSFAGNNGLAQLWLRRAAQIAPDEELREVAVADFRQVRRITPWRLALEVLVAPSDNLNNAPEEDTQVPGGTVSVLPPLSGLRTGVAAQLRYTLPLAPRSRLHLSGHAGGSVVAFSSEARDVPGAEAGDYSLGHLGGGVTFEAISADGAQLGRAGLRLSRHWQGGMPLADVVRLDLSLQRRVAPGLRFGARLGLEDVTRLDSSTGDSQRRAFGVSVTRDIGGGALTLDLGVGETFSAAPNVGRVDGEATLAFALAEPVRGMLPRVSLAYGAFDYDSAPAILPTGDPRADRRLELAVDVLLPELDYYGFAPEIGVSFTDVRSNYNLYESRGTDLRLGLKSVF